MFVMDGARYGYVVTPELYKVPLWIRIRNRFAPKEWVTRSECCGYWPAVYPQGYKKPNR